MVRADGSSSHADGASSSVASSSARVMVRADGTSRFRADGASSSVASSSAAAPTTSLRINFAAAAAGPALACLLTNPADVARTRLALDAALQPNSSKAYNGAIDCIRSAWRAEGLMGVQRGLGFAMLREASKNSFRIGLYDPIIAELTGGRRPATWGERFLAGGTSGGVAAIVCNPLDRTKTLLQLAGQTRGGVADVEHPARGLSAIVRDILSKEGVRGFWRGASVNVARSVFGTAVQLSTNSRLQELAAAAGVPKNAASDAACAFTASFFLVFVISPTDVVRARLYSQPVSPDGSGLHYRGPLHCAWRIVSAEGFSGLFKGVVASWMRVGPHTTLSLVIVSAIKRAAADPAKAKGG